jgi:hypothetical protein
MSVSVRTGWREMGLSFRIARASRVDPMRIGVATAAPEYRKLADKYLGRTPADADVNKTVFAALAPRADHWFVMVEGRSTVGKSRTLFEAIHRYDAEQDHLHLVAPRDAAALRDLLDPTKGVLRFGGPAVLWLDDVESSSIPV